MIGTKIGGRQGSRRWRGRAFGCRGQSRDAIGDRQTLAPIGFQLFKKIDGRIQAGAVIPLGQRPELGSGPDRLFLAFRGDGKKIAIPDNVNNAPHGSCGCVIQFRKPGRIIGWTNDPGMNHFREFQIVNKVRQTAN